MSDQLEAARFLARHIFEANAVEAERQGKPWVAQSERNLIELIDLGEIDDGFTIDQLVKDWAASSIQETKP